MINSHCSRRSACRSVFKYSKFLGEDSRRLSELSPPSTAEAVIPRRISSATALASSVEPTPRFDLSVGAGMSRKGRAEHELPPSKAVPAANSSRNTASARCAQTFSRASRPCHLRQQDGLAAIYGVLLYVDWEINVTDRGGSEILGSGI